MGCKEFQNYRILFLFSDLCRWCQTGYIHIAFSVGSRQKVDNLTEQLRTDGYQVISGPRTTGDGYYESCFIGLEGNQIEITI